jgi:hypothetical protein
VRGFACGCLVVVLMGHKGLLVVLSFGFLQVSLVWFFVFPFFCFFFCFLGLVFFFFFFFF